MLDDDAFARAWVESRDRARPRGERAIREELRLKGVDRGVIDTVLEERRDGPARGDADEDPAFAVVSADQAAAERLIARHSRALGRVAEPRARRQRAYALLARNGFDPDVCRIVAASVGMEPEDARDAG
jgi:regulatory protein